MPPIGRIRDLTGIYSKSTFKTLSSASSPFHCRLTRHPFANIIQVIEDVLLPIPRGVPIVPKNLMSMLTNLESLTQKINARGQTEPA